MNDRTNEIPKVDVKIITRKGLCIRCEGPVSQFCMDYGDDPIRGGIVKIIAKDKEHQRLSDICSDCLTDIDVQLVGFATVVEFYNQSIKEWFPKEKV